MVTAVQAAPYVAVAVSLVSLAGTALRAKGKWDHTNYLLESIASEIRGNERNHEAAHRRMDAYAERTEGRLSDHIARHRRV